MPPAWCVAVSRGGDEFVEPGAALLTQHVEHQRLLRAGAGGLIRLGRFVARDHTWAKEQTAAAQARIAAMPGHAAIGAELKALLAAGDPPTDYAFAGRMVLRFQRSFAHPHGVLSIGRRDKSGAPDAWREVLDVDALRQAEGNAYGLHLNSVPWAPPAYTHCVMSLSPLGSDEVELGEFDLTTGRFVKDGFNAPASRGFVAWLAADRLLIELSLNGAPKSPTGWPAEVKIWSRARRSPAAS